MKLWESFDASSKRKLVSFVPTAVDWIVAVKRIRFVEVMSNALRLVRIFAAIFREIICMFDCYAVLCVYQYTLSIVVRLSQVESGWVTIFVLSLSPSFRSWVRCFPHWTTDMIHRSIEGTYRASLIKTSMYNRSFCKHGYQAHRSLGAVAAPFRYGTVPLHFYNV